LAGIYDPRAYPFGIANRLLQAEPTKRKVFFSFSFADVMRVNVVRNAWKIDHPDSAVARTFYDSSLWEARELESDDSVKRVIREGVQYTSAVCVLIGSDTWSRRWVKYEIARALIDGRGLLAVHINGIRHHQRLSADAPGENPLNLLGIYRGNDGRYLLYEKQVRFNAQRNSLEWQWWPYTDYTAAVPLPKYMITPDVGYVMPLSNRIAVHDYCLGDGHKNLGSWVDNAATSAGR
jgi:hypothetical protein